MHLAVQVDYAFLGGEAYWRPSQDMGCHRHVDQAFRDRSCWNAIHLPGKIARNFMSDVKMGRDVALGIRAGNQNSCETG